MCWIGLGWVIDMMGWVGLGPANLDPCPSLAWIACLRQLVEVVNDDDADQDQEEDNSSRDSSR